MVLHKNKWDRKAKRAHERKLQAKAGTSGTDGAISQESGNRSNISRKHGVLVGPKSADAGDGEHRLGEEEGESGEEEGGVKVEAEDGAKEEGNKQDEDEAEEGEDKGKYSRRKIVDNSWRYEEPEEDPYLKAQNEEDEEPEPDYARMTIGKAQLKVSSDEEEEDEDFDQSALDKILIRDKPESKGPATKGKVVQVDRRQFQDIDEKVAKQKTAEAFRQRFAIRSKTKASPTNNFGVDNDNDADGDVDEFLEGLKLEARKPAQQSLRTTRISIAGKGLRSEEQDDKWLDEMLGARPAGAKGRS